MDLKRQRITFADIAALAGLALLAVGCWMAWRPLGLIVPGVLLMAYGVLAGLNEQRGEQ